MPDPRPDLARLFEAVGGEFPGGFAAFLERARSLRALIFDWDGVFNDGLKSRQAPSPFGEADSMGTNMCRYGLYRHAGDQLPYCAVMTGENNPVAVEFARREHFQGVYRGIPDKRRALAHFCSGHDIRPEQVAFVFDDVNDLGLAAEAGIRIQVRRAASPLMAEYVRSRGLADYITGAESGRGAVREACELILGALGQFDAVIDSRTAYDAEYSAYFRERQASTTASYTADADGEPVLANEL